MNSGRRNSLMVRLGWNSHSHLLFWTANAVLFLLVVSAYAVEIDRVSSDYSSRTIYVNGNKTRWVMGDILNQVSLSSELAGWRYRLDLRHSLPGGDLHWGRDTLSEQPSPPGEEDVGKLSGRILFQEQYFEAVASTEWLAHSLTLEGGWRGLTNDRHDLSIGFRYRPLSFLQGSARRSRRHPLPSFSKLFFEFKVPGSGLQREGGQIFWRAPTWVTDISFDLTPIERIEIHYQISEADLTPQRPIAGESEPGSYLGTLEGLWRHGHLRVRLITKRNEFVELSFRKLRLKSRLQAYDGGRRFAHFGIVHLDGSIWSLAAHRGSWKWHLSTGRAEGELRGVIEAWPFLDGLLRFVGERRHMVSIGDVDWTVMEAARRFNRRGRFVFDLATTWLHLTPDLRYFTWRPVAFGFGIDDLRSGQLSLLRADLIRVEIKPHFKWRKLLIEMSVSQWIPLSTKETEGEEDDPADPGDPTDVIDDSSKVWGGFSAGLRLRYDF